jgi:hypothetical protein
MFAVALPQNERLGTRSVTPLRVSRLERGPPPQQGKQHYQFETGEEVSSSHFFKISEEMRTLQGGCSIGGGIDHCWSCAGYGENFLATVERTALKLGIPPLPIHSSEVSMFKRNCVVKYVDNFGVEHAAKVEAESLFEAAIRGLHRLDSSFWTEDDVFDRMSITVEVYQEPTNSFGSANEL